MPSHWSGVEVRRWGVSSVGDRGSKVAKVTDSWPACNEFQPCTSKDSPSKGAMHIKSVQSSKVLPLVW
ncbi:hypothetical protein TNCV_3909441 [Trichonephila clavipes]|nr:hypothetical protein TNCV_3909441 [Trichonephila clavipes]